MKLALPIKKIKRKHWLRLLAIVLGSFILVISVGYIIVKANTGRIEENIKTSLNEQINGKVSIGRVRVTLTDHFPHFSVVFNNILITDDRFPEHKRQLFSAEKVFVQIRVFQLLRKKIEIRAITLDNASLNFIRMQDGKLNTEGLIKKPTDETKSDENTMLVSRVYLKNAEMHYEDLVNGKNYDLVFKESFAKINHGDSVSSIHTKDKIFVRGITFHPERGSCLTNTTLHSSLSLDWNRDENTITINRSFANIDKMKFTLQGKIKTGMMPHTQMLITSPSIKMNEALKLLSNYSREQLKGYDFNKPVSMSLGLEGNSSTGQPLNMDLNFVVKNSTFTMPSKTFDEVSLKGHYYNHLDPALPNDEKNSAISFNNFKGKFEGIPFGMELFMKDLKDPYIDMRINCHMPLTGVNQAMDTTVVRFTSGNIQLDADFKGKFRGYSEKEKDSTGASIFGYASITNASCTFPGKQYTLKNIEGKFDLADKTAYIRNLSFSINDNPVQLTATISQFVYALIFPEIKLQAEASVTCNKFNLDNFKKPVAIEKKPVSRKKIAATFASIMDNLEGNISLNAGKITYKKLTLSNVSGKVVLGNGYILCKGMAMHAAKGNFTLDGEMRGINSASATVNFSATATNADIHDVFYELDNFNQTAVTSENLKGNLDANATFSASLDRTFAIVPESMKGQVEIDITDGELVNMASLNQISKNVFKKKDFSDIQFAELKNTSQLDGQEFIISQMEIQSNVISMYIQGVYSFGDSTELFIRVPVKSLKNQDDDYIAENKSVDDKIGVSLNLKATKENGKLKVVPMLFRKGK